MDANDQRFLKSFVVDPIQSQIAGMDERLTAQITTLDAKMDGVPASIAAAVRRHARDCQAQRDREDLIEREATGQQDTPALAPGEPRVARRPSWPARAISSIPLWLKLLALAILSALLGGGAVSGITVELAEGTVRLDPSRSRPAAAASAPAAPADAPDVDGGPETVRQLL